MLSDIKSEISKIKFSNKKEFIQSVSILIIFVFVSGIVLAILDYLLSFISFLF